ncbi:MAG: hypothetical protein KY476_25840 [Planctomycetes bacterium]|nr:hypothetical protein [Planctomycetota bacterium]
MVKLSPEQREAIRQHPGMPIYVVDPDTGAKYALVHAATFQKVQALFADGDFDPEEFLPLVHEALAGDIDAPGMELYDEYETHRPNS